MWQKIKMFWQAGGIVPQEPLVSESALMKMVAWKTGDLTIIDRCPHCGRIYETKYLLARSNEDVKK